MKKIKIMHVVYLFELGGIESFILQLCNNMDLDKYELYLVTLINERLPKIHLFNSSVNIISLDYKQGDIRSFSGFSKTLNELVNVIDTVKPDIIHTHHEHYVCFFIQLASKLSKQKIINVRTVHSGGSFYAKQETLSDYIKLLIEKVTFKLFDVNLVAVSQAIYKNNIKYFSHIAKSNALIYNGIDINIFDKNKYSHVSRQLFGLDKDAIVYVYVARLNPGKNHEFLISQWNRVVSLLPNAILVFAGDGPLKVDLENKIIDSLLEQHVYMLGSINNVPDLLSVSDIGVFPSQFEGMSISLLEKFAMQLPVVASDIEAFTNVANDKLDSFLIPLEDEDEFVNTLIRLGKDASLRKEIGNNAYKTAVNYSLEKTILSYEKLYARIVEKEV
ncbi:glycosyltransferase family 4 protein [Aeromonas caviae]|uniref:glycosyltransferase family 4 protein n=1 Tax=Aeromonas caviae TaxID=648 RepID=UPI00214EA07C|nr:glycosyltransferase family 4 protein [Aeromonas caviae]MCR3895465.1 glycosyltransferase family 4 protein [Aeromonas caviae]